MVGPWVGRRWHPLLLCCVHNIVRAFECSTFEAGKLREASAMVTVTVSVVAITTFQTLKAATEKACFCAIRLASCDSTTRGSLEGAESGDGTPLRQQMQRCTSRKTLRCRHRTE